MAAEVEEIEEDHNKNLSTNELRRLKRDSKTVGSVPLHFEASKNDTDKSVHLTVTAIFFSKFIMFKFHF